MLPSPYYQDDWCVIYNADCRDVLPHLPKVDLLLTDPPYGIGEANGKNISRDCKAVATDYGTAAWDDEPISADLLSAVRDKAGWQIVFGGNYYSLPPSSCWLVWDKVNTGDFADCELAWTNLRCAVRRIQWRWNGMIREGNERRFHPTQKPLGVIRWAIALVPEDCRIILDPFMGSGTTLVAAKQLGRRAIGIEMDRKYCDIAIERLRQEPLPLFETPVPVAETLPLFV